MALYRHTIDRDHFEIELRVPVGTEEVRKMVVLEWIDRLEGQDGQFRHLYYEEPLFASSLIREEEVSEELPYILDHLGRESIFKFESRPRDMASAILDEAEQMMGEFGDGVSVESVEIADRVFEYCHIRSPGFYESNENRSGSDGLVIVRKPRSVSAKTAFEAVRSAIKVEENASTFEVKMDKLDSLQTGIEEST